MCPNGCVPYYCGDLIFQCAVCNHVFNYQDPFTLRSLILTEGRVKPQPIYVAVEVEPKKLEAPKQKKRKEAELSMGLESFF